MSKEEIIQIIEDKIKESQEILTHQKESHQFYYYNGGMDSLRWLKDVLKNQNKDN